VDDRPDLDGLLFVGTAPASAGPAAHHSTAHPAAASPTASHAAADPAPAADAATPANASAPAGSAAARSAAARSATPATASAFVAAAAALYLAGLDTEADDRAGHGAHGVGLVRGCRERNANLIREDTFRKLGRDVDADAPSVRQLEASPIVLARACDFDVPQRLQSASIRSAAPRRALASLALLPGWRAALALRRRRTLPLRRALFA
jgi:hypothetical protein